MKRTFLIMLICALILGMGTAGYAGWGDKTGETFCKEQELTEKNQVRLLKDTPSPMIEYSQERRNLIRRLKAFNTPDKISYIYLVSFGKVMAFYTVKGKVSSVNSLLTTPVQSFSYRGKIIVVPSPQMDGSYGENGPAIFFFTTEDVYVEWSGEYMLCDQPLKLATPPELVYVKELKK